MSRTARVVVGDCTTEFRGTHVRERRGRVMVVVKPDETVLVHDRDGYQPVAWLTRPASVTLDERTIVARDGDQQLRVTVHESEVDETVPVSAAGTPVGDCPDCDALLVRTGGAVSCVVCDRRFGLPEGATVIEDTCEDCAKPMMRVERGDIFDLCIDRDCEPLDELVRERFDRAWPCPQCGRDLRVLRRGGLIAGCDGYPDCETGFAFPRTVVAGECDCGLPRLDTSGGDRCLDPTCSAA